MKGKTPRERPAQWRRLEPLRDECAVCGRKLWQPYARRRMVATLDGMVGLDVRIRECQNANCVLHHVPYHPEAEGGIALPYYSYGLDVLAWIGALRYRDYQSVPQIHAQLGQRGVHICPRNVTYLLERYDELVACSAASGAGRERIRQQQRAILAIDGLQPEVGHEVLWVIREVLTQTVLLARPLLSSCQAELIPLLKEATADLGVPVAGVVSDGEESIRCAVAKALPGVPHQLCQFHYLRNAAQPLYEADRHAKKELKKLVRGVRPVERKAEGRDDEEGRVILGYCAAVRAALTDDGKAPLEPGGLKLEARLCSIRDSLAQVASKKRGACQNRWTPSARHCRKPWRELRDCGRTFVMPTAG